MSLVTALIDSGRLHINADLRVTQSDFLPINEVSQTPHLFNGTLKIIPVRDVAICYAGAVSTAISIIRTIANGDVIAEDIPAYIVSELEKTGDVNECDFLVVDATKQVMYKVHAGNVDKISRGRSWIGDIEAYEVFQQKLEELEYSENDNPIQKSVKMMNSMQAVIDDRSLESVGELPISAFNSDGKIQLSIAFMAKGPDTPIREGLHPAVFSADTNLDTLNLNVIPPAESGVAAIGIHIAEARKGALYIPLTNDNPILIDGDTLSEFREKVLAEQGIQLMGGGFELVNSNQVP